MNIIYCTYIIFKLNEKYKILVTTDLSQIV